MSARRQTAVKLLRRTGASFAPVKIKSVPGGTPTAGRAVAGVPGRMRSIYRNGRD